MDRADQLERYLARIGLAARPPATVDGLRVTSYDDWRGALVDDLLVPVDDVSPDEWSSVWDRTLTSHRAWDEAGRP